MIISVLNQKGGTGKTTVAVNIATYLANQKKSVMLIDSDKQGSASQWRENRADQKTLVQFPTVQITTPTIANDLPKMKQYDYLIIDVGGHDNKVFRSAIIGSDVVLVPITPSGVDFWSSEETFRLIEEARIYKELKVIGMINMLLPNTKVSHEIDELIEGFEKDYNMHFLSNRLVARVQYKYSLNDGIGITEQDTDVKAKNEFEELMKELVKCL